MSCVCRRRRATAPRGCTWAVRSDCRRRAHDQSRRVGEPCAPCTMSPPAMSRGPPPETSTTMTSVRKRATDLLNERDGDRPETTSDWTSDGRQLRQRAIRRAVARGHHELRRAVAKSEERQARAIVAEIARCMRSTRRRGVPPGRASPRSCRALRAGSRRVVDDAARVGCPARGEWSLSPSSARARRRCQSRTRIWRWPFRDRHERHSPAIRGQRRRFLQADLSVSRWTCTAARASGSGSPRRAIHSHDAGQDARGDPAAPRSSEMRVAVARGGDCAACTTCSPDRRRAAPPQIHDDSRIV